MEGNGKKLDKFLSDKKIVNLFLLFLIGAICLSPRLPILQLLGARNLDIRVEDIILAVGLLVWASVALIKGKHIFKAPYLFWPMLAWSLWGVLSVFSNLLLLQKGFLDISFFYFAKEIEFFLIYITVFCCLYSFNLSLQAVRYWLFFMTANVAWIVVVLLFKSMPFFSEYIYYGANAFIEPQGPFPSGGFFLLAFVFLFNLYLYYYNKSSLAVSKRYLVFLLCLAPVLGIFSSGSVTSIIGFAVSVVLSLGVYFYNKKRMMSILKATLVIFILGILLLFLLPYLGPSTDRYLPQAKILHEYTTISSSSRLGVFESHMEKLRENQWMIIFGQGILGEAHGYYTRVVMERGLVGLSIFLWLVASIVVVAYKNMLEKDDLFKKGLSSGLFVATITMLVMAIPNDVFAVVKIDEVYWFFTAMTMAQIAKSNAKSS